MSSIKFLFVPTLLFCSIFIFGQNLEKHHRVKVFANADEMNLLGASGVCIDHGEMVFGKFLINEFSESELAIIQTLGLPYEVLIEDLKSYIENGNFEAQNNASQNNLKMSNYCFGNTLDYQTPDNWHMGTFGQGYYFYDEMLDILDSMRLLYPELISERLNVNDTLTTYQGRNLFYLKISDNPDVDEAEEEVLYTALHHAREPMSAVQLIYYMWYLLENYDNNPKVQYLLNNSEMYFVPCVNPDGYIYDQTSAPNGGGYWRKNRKPTDSVNIGVDLNRNYGYNWAFDDLGSSPITSGNTYRGDAPFSESETAIIKTFCENHEFKLALNYHSYGNLLITPFGYDFGINTPDSIQFRKYANIMTAENCFAAGTVDEVLGYVANGNSDDWMYGEQTTKNKIFSFTPEVGIVDYGFYPPQIAIEEICKSTIKQNLETAHLALKYISVEVEEPIFLKENTAFIKLKTERLGMQQGNFTVNIVPVNNAITNVGSGLFYNSLSLLNPLLDSISITLDSNLISGDEIIFDVEINNGSLTETKRYTKTYLPNPVLIFFEDANTPNTFTTNNIWNTSALDFYSGPLCFTDSPDTSIYFGNNKMIFNDTIDLTSAANAFLQFRIKHSVEPRYEFVQVFVKTENAMFTDSIPLCGKYTQEGSYYQDNAQAVYAGKSNGWLFEEIDLTDYLGQKILLGFKTGSLLDSEYDGVYIDDIAVWKNFEDTIINPVTDLPIAVDDNFSFINSIYGTLNVSTNDSLQSNINYTISLLDSSSICNLEVNGLDIIFNTTFPNYLPLFQTDTFSYIICDTLLNCDTASIILSLDFWLLNIDEVQNEIKIYPNPVNNIATISSENWIIENYILYDEAGKTMLSKTANQQSLQLDLSNYPKGIYFIKGKLSNGKSFNKEVLKM